MRADKLYLGNVITMDDHKPTAEAVAVKDGLIMYVGGAETARALCDNNTEIIDLGTASIYPGFLEAHCHPMGAGKLLDTESLADLSAGESLEDYIALIAEFIKAHPNKKMYMGAGFMEREVKPTAAMIDTICSDIPVAITSTDGHSMWLNTKAMEFFGITRAAVAKYGEDLVRIDINGDPTGYISENPVFDIRNSIKADLEDCKRFLMNAQKFFFSKGYTAIYDAGMELIDKSVDTYHALSKTDEMKIRIFGGSLIDEHCPDIKAAVENIAAMREKYNNDHFKIIGVKTFSDGVIEAHTGLLMEDYLDQPGYKGTERLTDHDKLVQVYENAIANDMCVHVHTVGDGAIHCNLDAIEEAEKRTGKMDNRFALAHLQLVNKDDIKRFADLNVVAVVASLWSPKHPDYFKQELEYVGETRAESAYPIKSFVNAGAVTAFHTDFPVSRNVSIPNAVYTAVMRKNPDTSDDCIRKSDEKITRKKALESMTKNVAYMWHEDDRMGTLTIGKLANMAVFDKDFLNDDIEEIGKANLVCTIVDGNIVYKA